MRNEYTPHLSGSIGSGSISGSGSMQFGSGS